MISNIQIAQPYQRQLVPVEPDSEIGGPIPPNFSFRFLNLPNEIRFKIYRYLFRSDFPLHPKISTPQIWLKDRSTKTNFPTPLLLVNRQIHDEAISVLWGENQILLQFPFHLESEYQNADHREQPLWMMPTPSCGGFMPPRHHLQQIRKLTLEIGVFRDSNLPMIALPRGYTTTYRELAVLSTVLQERTQLQHLEIRFTNFGSRLPPYHMKQHFPVVVEHGQLAPGQVGARFPAGWLPSCCAAIGRRAYGKEIQFVGQIQELCKQAIVLDQKVLEPLVQVRGVRCVHVVGRVSDDWKAFLKRAIESERGTQVGDFDYNIYRAGDRFRDTDGG